MANLFGNIMKFASTGATIGSSIGSSFMKKKGYLLGSVAGGFIGSSLLSNYAERKKNYYGEELYKSRYKNTIENTATALPYLGVAAALGRWTGKDIFGLTSRAAGTVRNISMKSIGMRSLATAKGLKASDYGLALGGAAATMIGNNLETAALATAGIGGLAAYSAVGRSLGFGGATATVAAGVGMGYAASTMPQYAAGEGNITDFREHNPNQTRKLDFNTAGLVQALHTNRKAY